jgi:hypothetical protein
VELVELTTLYFGIIQHITNQWKNISYFKGLILTSSGWNRCDISLWWINIHLWCEINLSLIIIKIVVLKYNPKTNTWFNWLKWIKMFFDVNHKVNIMYNVQQNNCKILFTSIQISKCCENKRNKAKQGISSWTLRFACYR